MRLCQIRPLFGQGLNAHAVIRRLICIINFDVALRIFFLDGAYINTLECPLPVLKRRPVFHFVGDFQHVIHDDTADIAARRDAVTQFVAVLTGCGNLGALAVIGISCTLDQFIKGRF